MDVLDHRSYDVGELLQVSFLWYNILIHTPITLVNSIIMIKEIALEFVQVSERRDGHDSNVAIGLVDWWDLFTDILAILNPLNWLKYSVRGAQTVYSY